MKSVLLLNDTSNELHVGSTAISLRLRGIAEACGCTVTSAGFANGRYHLPKAAWDYVIVNAEGTLSRDTSRAEALITEISRIKAPMALMSGDLCASNAAKLRGIRFRVAHYRRPHDMNQQVEADGTYMLPDLFYHIVKEVSDALPSLTKRAESYWVVGDSHNHEDFEALQAYCKSVDFKLRSQSMIVEQVGAYSFTLPLAQRLRNRLWFASRSNIAIWRRRYSTPNIETWVATLAQSQGLITGRFHQAVGALAVGVPVRFVESQTTKIQKIGDFFPECDLHSIASAPKGSASDAPSNACPQYNFDVLFSHLNRELRGGT